MKLRIGYFYSNLLNLYGDTGNIEILTYRAQARDIETEVVEVNPASGMDTNTMKSFDFVFMGGGPDSSQKIMYQDLLKNKGPYLKEYIENAGVGLFVCGSYQLLGKYYKSADGTILDGLSVFDLYTESFGNRKPRCIGNVVCEINKHLAGTSLFENINQVGNTLVGFENHGGRTYLAQGMVPLANVIAGHGNNSEDGHEGVLFKNSIGTYMHGPILSKNPHLADYLIAKSLKIDTLDKLNDALIISAHTAAKKLK
jgi:lipid II isoglutaminyl synthase (glutamine-hydrolysing)